MHPIQLIIGMLTSFFRKLLLYYSVDNKSNSSNVAQKMGVTPFFLNDYITAARNYSADKVVHIISLIREYDLRSKGARGGNTENGELLRELIYKILHL